MTRPDVDALLDAHTRLVASLSDKDLLSDSYFEEEFVGGDMVSMAIKPFKNEEVHFALMAFTTALRLKYPHLNFYLSSRAGWQVVFAFSR